MKLLMLNYEYPPLGGGAGNACYYILKELSRDRQLEIDLITSSVDQYQLFQLNERIKIHCLDIGKKGNLHYQTNKDLLTYSWKAYHYARQLVKKKSFDLVHAFFGIPCGFIAMQLKLPYIVSLRGSDVPFYNKRFEKIDHLVFKHLSKIIWDKAGFLVANSRGLKELALKTNSSREILIIPNGVDLNEFCPAPGKAANDKRIIISTGRLIKRKGYEYLIQALKGLHDYKLILIGDGDLKHTLKRLAFEQKVDVDFLGKVNHSEIIDHLQKADIFVLPSLNEGMSNSILEAIACGLPIILSDVGGCQELINGNGFTVKKKSVNDLRAALIQYLEQPELINTHSLRSRAIASRMSWEKVADQYDELYKKMSLSN